MQPINNKSKEIKNKFICPVCEEQRLRGHYVRVKYGPHKGFEVKVCKNASCVKAVLTGMVMP